MLEGFFSCERFHRVVTRNLDDNVSTYLMENGLKVGNQGGGTNEHG
jgi:hypothetical protein